MVGIEDYFYNPMVYNLSYGVLAPVVDGGESKVQVRRLLCCVPAFACACMVLLMLAWFCLCLHGWTVCGTMCFQTVMWHSSELHLGPSR